MAWRRRNGGRRRTRIGADRGLVFARCRVSGAPQAFSKGRASARRIYEVVDRVPVIDIHRRGPRAAARAASPAHCRGRRRFRAEFRRPVIIML